MFRTSLGKRAALGGSDGGACCHSHDNDRAAPISGDLTLHDIFTYTSFGCTILCLLVTAFLFVGHICNYREPRYQRQIIRIVLTPAAFAVFNFLGVWSYRTTDYVTPIADIYEAFVFIAILYMLLAYALPSSVRLNDQITCFTQHARFTFRDFRRSYCYMVQFLPVTFCCVVINTIIMANTCLGGRGWRHAHLIIAIVGSVSTVLAVLGLFGIYRKLKADIKKVQPRILGQLFIFKVIVLLHFVQGLLLSILKATNTLKPTSTMSYNDLNLGLGPFLTCCEALIIVCGMCYFYNPNMHGKNSECVRASNESPDNDATALEDGSKRNISKPKLGPVKAIWDVINVYDVLVGMRNGLWLLSHKSVVA